jgi:hypothetical protein
MTYDDNPEVARASSFIRSETEMHGRAEVPMETQSYRLAVRELFDTGEFHIETFDSEGWHYARVTPILI